MSQGSREAALEVKLRGPGRQAAVSLARYAGQESDEQKNGIIDSPPDFLLSKYVMLELILTRPEEAPLAREHGDRALRLSCTGPEMVGYWNALAERGRVAPVPGQDVPQAAIDAAEREFIRLKIEAPMAREVFNSMRERFEVVLDGFSLIEAAEDREPGEYRTKWLAHTAYDALATGEAEGAELPESATAAEPA